MSTVQIHMTQTLREALEIATVTKSRLNELEYFLDTAILRPSYTTVARDAITTPPAGFVIFNTTTNQLNFYSGAAWLALDTTAGGDVSGSGITGYAPIWTDGPNSVLGSSVLFQKDGNVIIGSLLVGDTMTNGVALANGAAPTSDIANQFSMYSADVIAGNAAPHFRTEAGNIIKLFTGAALSVSLTTLTQAGAFTPDYAIQAMVNGGWGFATQDEAETVLSVVLNMQARINELEARLQASGQLV